MVKSELLSLDDLLEGNSSAYAWQNFWYFWQSNQFVILEEDYDSLSILSP